MSELLVPVQKDDFAEGSMQMPAELCITAPSGEDALPARQLAEYLRRKGINAWVDNTSSSQQILLCRDKAILHPQGYTIDIQSDRTVVRASTAAGIFYGAQTFLELVREEGTTIKCRHIEDWPAFSRRAVYHDSARGKVPSVDTVKALVRRLAHWKINELQLYIENAFTFSKHPAIGEGYSPYTPEEIREMQSYCQEYHVRFVPSLTSFGHFEKILILPVTDLRDCAIT